MRAEVLSKIHYSHLGFNKCIQLANSMVYWPTMRNEIKQVIENCHICQKYSKSNIAEPLKSHEILQIPWYKVGCDLFQHKDKKYLLVVDYYSKYVELEEVTHSIVSHSVIKSLKNIFARHGIPAVVANHQEYYKQLKNKQAYSWEAYN